ncbi:MAG TPA: YfiR family protein [Caulobacteraceae bacterium]|jgi:hypothetical protein|nr:YfiR family protein [Caulobacteraceae bacterium]
MTKRPGRRLAAWFAAGLTAAAVLQAPRAAAQEASRADATKAAMIYNFGRFTTWAPNRFARSSDPVVLCVDPSDSFAGTLESIDGKALDGRVLVVKRTSRFDRDCTMAYVSAANASPAYLTRLRDHGVLTIGETRDFASAGAIQLVTVGRQIRFEINQKNAISAGAHLSSNLLRLAITVR